MKILYSTEIFTRRGKRRLRGLLEQLVASTPVFEPTTSTLLDGTWERQGQHPRRVKTIELKAGRDSMMYTYDFYVGGLVKITQVMRGPHGGHASLALAPLAYAFFSRPHLHPAHPICPRELSSGRPRRWTTRASRCGRSSCGQASAALNFGCRPHFVL